MTIDEIEVLVKKAAQYAQSAPAHMLNAERHSDAAISQAYSQAALAALRLREFLQDYPELED